MDIVTELPILIHETAHILALNTQLFPYYYNLTGGALLNISNVLMNVTLRNVKIKLTLDYHHISYQFPTTIVITPKVV